MIDAYCNINTYKSLMAHFSSFVLTAIHNYIPTESRVTPRETELFTEQCVIMQLARTAVIYWLWFECACTACTNHIIYIIECVCVCLSVGGSHKSSENKGKSLKYLVVVFGLSLHILSHIQSKQGTFTLSALPMTSIKLRTSKFIVGTFSQTVISKCPYRAMIQTDQLKGYL
jgi:hypothetical protein